MTSSVFGGAATTAIVLTEHLLLLAAGACAALILPIRLHCIAMAGIAAKTYVKLCDGTEARLIAMNDIRLEYASIILS